MSLLLAYFSTLLLAHLAQLTLPRPIRPRLRTLRLGLLQTVWISGLFADVLLLTARPLLAGIITLAILAVLLVVNHAKYRALQEPLVFSDIHFYLQVFTHPRLFLPFLPIPLTLSAITAGLMLLGSAWWLEPSLDIPALVFYPALIASYILTAWLMRLISRDIQLQFEPVTDVRTVGFYNSLKIYALQAGTLSRQVELRKRLHRHSPFNTGKKAEQQTRLSPQADMIVVQSESFFDARRWCPAIKPEILQHFDQIRAQSVLQGRLHVPAWGANTLRTEFAFLSGVDNRQLEHYRYNPYQYLQYGETPTLASYLKAQGYRCICIHPNDSAFFKRGKVFPKLGFDEFLDKAAFIDSPTAGPYISDAAVADKIRDVLAEHTAKADTRPLFIFAITMENHGPLHLESHDASEVESYYQCTPPKQHHDLTVYLRHLQNADRMLDSLTQQLEQHPREALLCWYGDHIPSMPDVYAELPPVDGCSDYLVWSNRHAPFEMAKKAVTETVLDVSQLAVRACGL